MPFSGMYSGYWQRQHAAKRWSAREGSASAKLFGASSAPTPQSYDSPVSAFANLQLSSRQAPSKKSTLAKPSLHWQQLSEDTGSSGFPATLICDSSSQGNGVSEPSILLHVNGAQPFAKVVSPWTGAYPSLHLQQVGKSGLNLFESRASNLI
jgi:hypothetical protein